LKTAYLKCKVLPGLFDTEYYVLVNGSSAAYVNRANVNFKGLPKHRAPVEGRVFVYVIDRKPEESLVEFTGEAVVGGLRTWVPNTLFARA
jgi:hypothetical protein